MTCKYSDVYMQLTINLDHSSFRDFFLADIMLLLYVTARLGCFSPIGSCGRNELSCPLNSMSCGVVIDFLRLDGYLCPNRIFRRTWPSLGCRCASSLCHPAAAAAASAAPVAPSVAGPSAVRPARSAPAASLCAFVPASASSEWCSSWSPRTAGPALSAVPNSAATELVCTQKSETLAGCNKPKNTR